MLLRGWAPAAARVRAVGQDGRWRGGGQWRWGARRGASGVERQLLCASIAPVESLPSLPQPTHPPTNSPARCVTPAGNKGRTKGGSKGKRFGAGAGSTDEQLLGRLGEVIQVRLVFF